MQLGRRCWPWAGPRASRRRPTLNRELWIGAVIASLVVGVIVWGLIFWSSAFHRKKATDTELPRQFGYNMPLELVLTVTPFLIISVLFYFTVVVQEKMLHMDKNPEVVIDVTAFQWNWKFGYQRVNFKDGTLTYDGADEARKKAMVSKPEGKDDRGEELVGAVHGLNTEDRTYLNFDKVETLGTSTEIPMLVLPTGKRIEFQLDSADVIHAFWVPEFLFKRDVMPNPKANNSVNVFQVEEITKTGAFVGHCAEMCGTYHSMMNFEVRVVEPNDFKAYLQQRIAGKTNAEALQAIAQPPMAVTTHPFDTRRGELARKASKLGHAMHIEARLFEFIAAFFVLIAVLYGVLTALFATGGEEWAGTTALVLTGGLALITATFFRFVARRLDTRPEDYEGAEISDGAGELGFFSPAQLVADADRVVGLGGGGRCRAVAAVADRCRRGVRPRSAAGLVFEYYVGPEKH